MTSISSSTPIVVTPSVLTSSMISNLTTDQTNQANLEQQLSTGDAINSPSDNPAGASNILQLQGTLTRANQYAANAADGVGWLSLGNSTVNSVLGVLQNLASVVEGVSGSSLMSNPSTITSTSAQVSSALSQLINLANTTEEGGQPLFAGTGNADKAYQVTTTTDPVTGLTTEYANYVGNSSAPTRTVAPGTQVAVSATGPQVFGADTITSGGSSSANPNALLTQGGVLNTMITNLNTAASDLAAGNRSGASAALAQVTGQNLTDLQTALSTAENAAGVLGANQQSVQNFATQATNSATAVQGELASVQDTNMAQAITDLQLQQTAYQSALYATSLLSQDSLVKYL